MPLSEFLALLSSATLKILISGVSSQKMLIGLLSTLMRRKFIPKTNSVRKFELELLLAEIFWMEPTGNSNERPDRKKVSAENCKIYVHFLKPLI